MEGGERKVAKKMGFGLNVVVCVFCGMFVGKTGWFFKTLFVIPYV